jgi:ABC-type phosphate/phosphonate transport system substrate-binding protein
MQKTLVILICALFFGAPATSKASPLDSPDIVYIDGQPCNSACQSYMAWSRQIMPVRGQPPRVRAKAVAHQQPPNAAARRATRIRDAGSKPAANDRLAKQAVPTSTEMPQARTTDLQPAGKAAASSDTAGAKIADSVSTIGTATHSGPRTTVEQVTAAVAVAERLTATTAVAIVIARPEIKSVSDLAGKGIAINNGQSVSSDSVRTAIVKAGAAEVQLTENQAKALGRMISGEVPAAVLTLASPEAAEGFPEIAGFKIFRIPLTPEIARVKNTAAASDAAGAKLAGLPSAAAVATDFHTRTTRELVTAATAVAERMTAPRGVDSSDRPETALSNDTDLRIAILMARPEIKSVSDLTGKEIAIDGKLSAAASDHVQTAMAAAGATEVQLAENQTNAIDRVIGGEVSAAVLTLASPEAADGFPEVAGFRILRIPLSSHSISTRKP